MNKLQRVTSDTCKLLRQKDIILPSTYFEEFTAKAQELNIDFENNKEIRLEIENDIKKVHEIIH